ncbi:MAG: aminotransferase class V-fold PLP-dependent enzyme [Deltaproteobacteria bacterium]|nr:aminotransferase class V-fold PLP-dependent enzyme [Deltaproteobacteria bacterium]MBW2154792.1 aminotransferase class V-fold PLP-dependent enzyme [Deltaproteobacteria bacterium]
MDHVVRIDNGLIPKSEFIGLENIVHLAAGGEAPMLKSHIEVVNRFMSDKALAENSRVRMDDTVNRCKNKVATLFNVAAEDIALLSSSSEGINNLVYGLKWKPGDNVVACDVEFPSEILPWTRLKEKGVEIRIVRNRDWYVSLKDIERKIDKRTKIVAISQVSYFTGQRLPLAELSQMVRSCGALLCVDSTHSAGVIPVEAKLADIMVASCYKWLLATHGVAIFYLNRDRLENFDPPFLGWHSSVSIPDWKEPTVFELRANADRFEPGNHGFISVYVLDNALEQILRIGVPEIEKHVLELSGQLRAGLEELGFELMTPQHPSERAGNVCFMTQHIDAIVEALKEKGILVWGGYAGVGRVRVSTHLYNTSEDVNRLLGALKELPKSLKP